MAIPKDKLMRRRQVWLGSQMDCGNEGCGFCRVCRRLAFHEYVSMVGPRDVPHSIERDDVVDGYIRKTYGNII